MALEKADLIIEKEKGGPETFQVMFNPEEYRLSSSASYGEKKVPGLDGPIAQFISGEATELSMTLIFDTYKPPSLANKGKEGGEDVTKLTKKVSSLIHIQGALHRPPKVTFQWGPLHFNGIVTKVEERYTMFLSNGMPVRAKLDVTFRSVLDVNLSKRSEPFESPDRTKVRVVQEGKQLWHYAWEEYKDAGQWRAIAKANGISNPLELEPGQTLRLPALS